jgi:hypothetical protein
MLGEGFRKNCQGGRGEQGAPYFGFYLSNGHSLANLANSSTCQNGLFRKCVGLARLADIRRAVLRGLARLADIRRAILRGLARLAKGKFGECYVNLASLASLASLANLASVG